MPRRAIVNVSIDADVWSYFGNHQDKVSESFPYWRWDRAEERSPRRDARTRRALAEALALFELGRSPEARLEVARRIALEATFKERWLRDLALAIKGRR